MRQWLVSGVKNTQNRTTQTSQGERTHHLRTGTPNSSRIPGASLLSLGPLLPFSSGTQSINSFKFQPCDHTPPPALGDLYCYISLSSVHSPPTLVSHPCPYSSARPISRSFWRSVSCCGPHRTIQGLHPHQLGRGVSYGYLIRR